jgi:hypothetical protein
MSETTKQLRPIQSLVCCQCHKEIGFTDNSTEKSREAYCESCKPVGELKQTWRPLGAGRVSGIFRLRG